jgi:hypothetical protein
VNARGLFIALVFLEPDGDKIAGLKHLRCRLSKARLVAVKRRQGPQSGHPREQGEQGDNAKPYNFALKKGGFHPLRSPIFIKSLIGCARFVSRSTERGVTYLCGSFMC